MALSISVVCVCVCMCAAIAKSDVYRILTFAIECRRCWEYCTPWPCPTFSRSNIQYANICETMRASAKMHRTIFFIILIFAIERHHCESCTLWPWPTFQGQTDEMLISLKRWFLYRYWYLPSKDAIAKVVLRDHDLLFQGQADEMLISFNRWERAQKCIVRFLDSDIFHRKTQWWKL